MSRFTQLKSELRREPRRWLVTGCAGFIGSNLVEVLLRLDQEVVGLDNFSTGHRRNLDDVRRLVGPERAARFRFVEGDIRDRETCARACAGLDYVLHQAALGSVPRSIEDPLASHESNVDGFLNMLVAARDAEVRRFVYAASSSTYGDAAGLPKVEDAIGRPLSPYAVTKYVNELYAGVFARTYGVPAVGLRYFNVFGRRQDPHGPYAAVIPRWVSELLAGRAPTVHGDGETTRDFCHIDNAVQANLLAACVDAEPDDAVYNVAHGERTSLNQLFALLQEGVAEVVPDAALLRPGYGPFRAGDVRHSQADIGKIRRHLGYEPTVTVAEGLREALPWYVQNLPREAPVPA
jgi:UDP-N-acetylglucosamine 4-epimerase